MATILHMKSAEGRSEKFPLTNNAAAVIAALASGMTQAQVAAQFGVCQSAISYFKRVRRLPKVFPSVAYPVNYASPLLGLIAARGEEIKREIVALHAEHARLINAYNALATVSA
jgi:hypothetical protein